MSIICFAALYYKGGPSKTGVLVTTAEYVGSSSDVLTGILHTGKEKTDIYICTYIINPEANGGVGIASSI